MLFSVGCLQLIVMCDNVKQLTVGSYYEILIMHKRHVRADKEAVPSRKVNINIDVT